MDEETQKEMVELLKRALVAVAAGRRDEQLLFELRDIVRKVEGKGGEDA